MSKIEEIIELLKDMRKTHRMQPLGYGKMMEDSFNEIFALLESEPECPNCGLTGEAAKLPHSCKLPRTKS